MTVGYTRLSFDKYDDQLGVTRQREDITALARSMAWPEVTEFYEDNDVSANADKRLPRPQFDRLLRDMRAGVVAHVLCYDQDRLVRDMRQLEDVVDAVEVGRVMLTSVNGDIDLRSDNGRMVARIKAAVARNELEKMSRRIKRQKRQRAQLGFKNGSIHRTFGYDRDFTVVPGEAAVLVELFQRKAAGDSIASLVSWLNSTGVETTTGLVGRWEHSRVAILLRRREYIGDVTLNGAVVGPAAFRAIIDRAIFEEVNSCLPISPAPWRAAAETGLLTGLLVCGVCGTRMRRGRGTTTRRLYGCRGYRQSCESKLSVAADGEVVNAVRVKVLELRSSGGAWRSAQAGAIEHEIVQAGRQHVRGALTQAELDSVLKHLRLRLSEERRPPGAPQELTGLEAWDGWPLDAKREWLAAVVDRVVVAKSTRPTNGPGVDLDRLSIHFKDGQTLKLGRPILTMDDVARRAECSRKTASDSLNGNGRISDATRERVRVAAADLGYVPVMWRSEDSRREGTWYPPSASR